MAFSVDFAACRRLSRASIGWLGSTVSVRRRCVVFPGHRTLLPACLSRRQMRFAGWPLGAVVVFFSRGVSVHVGGGQL